MTSPRSADLAAFAEACFEKRGYAATFPSVFAHGTPDHLHPIFHKGELVALAATRLVTWHCADRLIRGLCVGSVCSSAAHRGLGFGYAALAKAERYAESVAADFLFLFSDRQEYYERAGYRSHGTEYFLPFSSAPASEAAARQNRATLATLIRKPGETVFTLISSDDLRMKPELSRKIWQFLYAHANPAESMLSHLELTESLEIPNLHFLLLERQNQPAALAMFGKGADFENIVHGLCAVDAAHGYLLLQESCNHIPGGFTLMVPPGWEDRFGAFAHFSAPLLLAKLTEEASPRSRAIIELIETRCLYPRSLQSI
jgi:GNAT superfamily N-acetyltransferase